MDSNKAIQVQALSAILRVVDRMRTVVVSNPWNSKIMRYSVGLPFFLDVVRFVEQHLEAEIADIQCEMQPMSNLGQAPSTGRPIDSIVGMSKDDGQ